ncbi:sugar-binding transcriptional regulator [Deinococcus sp. Marseille-Q6407]|uniref:sugar-binding transcriptional regulator n=1 Tax=Deinococcus sp. Marseille-Q6407 TaxID=2969223 RepID=UPI0021BFB823|nr:sugar-binding transcriptional regulator [Deinococcus sp. Marseille-Q6407]
MTSVSQTALAVQVARLYYHQGLTTGEIAAELGLSRPKVSRLLSFARESGLVEIRIHDPAAQPHSLAGQLQERFPGVQLQVVGVPPGSPEEDWLPRVAQATAALLDSLLRSGMTVGLAWGNTLDAVSHALTPRRLGSLDFVQLNGSANIQELVSGFVTDTVTRFARNYGGRAHLFPVPTFFDDPRTKQMMWQERSVRQVLDLQAQADVLLYSVGSSAAGRPSHVYTAGALDEAAQAELGRLGVAGDIATVFFRDDGSWEDLPINARASGPDLEFIASHPQSVCVVSGLGKVPALHAALRGGLMKRLIVDEPTALALLQRVTAPEA